MGNKKVLSPNNIWSKEGFQMCGLGEKSKTITRIKHISKCIRWSYQHIAGGYLGEIIPMKMSMITAHFMDAINKKEEL